MENVRGVDSRSSTSIPAKISALMIISSVSELFLKTERIYYPLFVALLLIYFFQQRKGKILANYTLLIIFFAFYALLSVIWSPLSASINSAFTKVVVLLFLWIQLQFEYSENDYHLIRNAFIIQAVLFLIVVAVFGVYIGEGRLWISRGDVGADPNSVVVWTLIPMCMAFEIGMDKAAKPLLRIGAFVLIALLVRVVFQCGSRAGIIAAAFGAISCVIYALRYNIVRKPLVALLIVLLAAAAAVYIYNHIPASVILRFQYSNTLDFGGRTVKWESLLDLLKKSPLNLVFGFGESGTIAYTTKVAHNMYVEILFNQGIVGIGMIVAYMFCALRNIVHRNVFTTIAFVSVAIMSASLSEFSSRGVMLSFFIAGAKWLSSDAETQE